MTDIPADVMEAARAAEFECRVSSLENMRVEAIARAIMVERERCAAHADQIAAYPLELKPGEYTLGAMHAAKALADAIRKGSKP